MSVFKPLALRVPHQFDEPPPYFAARLAARNLRPARMFARDMGLDLVRLANGCDESIRTLAELGGENYRSLIDCALRKTDSSIELKGQQLRKLSLRRARTHVCPACLLDDIANSDLPPHLAVHGRSSWLLSAIRTCHIHEAALVEVARGAPVHDTHDWTTSVAPIVSQLQSLEDAAIRRPVSALEQHLLDRLAGRLTISWLNEFPFFAAEHISVLIGAVAIFGKRVTLTTLSEDDRYRAGHAGTTIANAGPNGLMKFMETMMSGHVPKKGPPGDGPHAVFGKLYDSPAHGLRDRAYDPLREVMLTFILNHFPLGSGDKLFGKRVVKRQLHSVRSASLAYKCGAKRLRKLLVAEGLSIAPNALDREIIFDAKHAERIFRREKDSLTRKEAQAYLKIGQVQIDAFLDGGLIKRHHAGHGLNEFYRRSELDEFMSFLFGEAAMVSTVPDGTVDIHKTAKRLRRTLVEVVQAILQGKLSCAGRREGCTGFASILLNLEEARAATKGQDPRGVPAYILARMMKTNARGISQLISLGILKYVTVINPVNRCPLRIIEFAEIERFRKEYVSLHQLAQGSGRSMPTINSDLRREGITAVNFAGVSTTFYRRADIQSFNLRGSKADGAPLPV